MTEFEKCLIIRNIIMRRAAEVMVYTNWSDSFAKKYITEIPKDVVIKYDEDKPNEDKLFPINPHLLTSKEMDDLQFGLWSDESKLRLIPLWLFLFIDPDIEVISINGNNVKAESMDNDNRFGMLAYGIIPVN